LTAEYVLPLRHPTLDDGSLELARYLRELAQVIDVTVVDSSPAEVRAAHAAIWGGAVRQLGVRPWPGANGKVAAVVTGVRAARHENVVIADDDVRYRTPELTAVVAALSGADLVRPQNVFVDLPWHARWDTARTLLNRALGTDHPGTFGLRRDTFLAMGGYDGDVLFENLELSRTVRATGGVEVRLPGVFVPRRAPTTRHFLGQRVRQAYDDLAQPTRLVAEASLLPMAGWGLARALRSRRGTPRSREVLRGGAHLAAGTALAVLVAETGRRRHGGARIFPRTAALWAPLWLAERAACVWLALAARAAGGVRYSDGRLGTAAHSERWLRRHRDRPPLTRLP
jgi:hypothetical protein